MKKITEKLKNKSSSLRKAIRSKQRINEKERKITKDFNKYFTSAGTALVSKSIQSPNISRFVSENLLQCDALIELKELSFQEFEKAFKILKRSKAVDCDGFNDNIILDVYDSVKLILFRYLLKKHSFLKHLKLQKVMQAFQKGNKENVENC